MYRFIQRAILVAIGLTMPLTGFSTSIGGYPISPAKITTGLLILLAGLQFSLSSQRRFPTSRGVIPIVIFCASLVVSSFVSLADGMHPWIVAVAASRYFGLVAFYMMLIYVVRSRDDLVLLAWALVIGGAITGFPGLIEIQEGSYLDVGERTEGLSGKSNSLGYDLAICLPVAFALYFTSKSVPRRILAIAFAAIMVVGIVGSQSRSTFVSICAMYGFWVWRSRRFDTLQYLVPGVVVVVALAFVLPQQVYDRFDTMIDPQKRAHDRSINSRFLQAGWALKAVASNPAVGIGVNNYIPWVQRQPGGSRHYNSMHSGFLHILATQGLFGFLPFVAVIFVAWTDYSQAQGRARARSARGDPALRELGGYALFLQIALLGAMTGALTHPMSTNKGWWMLMALSTMVVALTRQRATELDGELRAPQTTAEFVPSFGGRPDLTPIR